MPLPPAAAQPLRRPAVAAIDFCQPRDRPARRAVAAAIGMQLLRHGPATETRRDGHWGSCYPLEHDAFRL